jgi:phosphopantothenoylcysteine decarboxylase/phosphopantothenate--cysteine ligase
VTAEGSVFGSDTNRVTLLGRDGYEEELPLMSKYDVSGRILDRIVGLLEAKAR